MKHQFLSPISRGDLSALLSFSSPSQVYTTITLVVKTAPRPPYNFDKEGIRCMNLDQAKKQELEMMGPN